MPIVDYTFNDTIRIKLANVTLTGDLMVVENAAGLVIFSHGSGSSRLSSRNRYVAQYLQRSGFATLLFDLLTEEEDQTYATRFNIPLLTERLVETTHWIVKEPTVTNLGIGYFGASTGAASALGAAAVLGKKVNAVVSRGGRPDLVLRVLPLIKAPVLLIVGANDEPVIGMNQQAYDKLQSIKQLEIIPGATHLFEEPGTLEEVAQLAANWFGKYVKS